MEWNETKTLVNIRQADSDDLLDRITAYRAGMETEAVALIEAELHRRGVTADEIARRREACQRECVFHADGIAKTCAFCRKPAVCEAWGWHKLFGRLPLFPRLMCYCKEHGAKK